MDAQLAQESAELETIHGNRDRGLALFDTAIDAYHRAGNTLELAAALASLAVFFDHAEQLEAAATLHGTSTRYGPTAWVLNATTTVEHLCAVLGPAVFDERVAAGAAMEPGDAVQYARHQIRLARQQASGSVQ